MRKHARALRHALRVATHVGRRRFCTVCEGSFRSFLPYGVVPRPDACCPRCGSLERQRLLWTALTHRLGFPEKRTTRVLHFAPERCLEVRLRERDGLHYWTADLVPAFGRIALDITALPFRPKTFDVVLCSHVLEHVPDDRAAMRELRRVLSPDGWAAIQVPQRPGSTDEDPALDDPAERTRRFGQPDHVRYYGDDFRSRLEDADFRVRAIAPADVFDEATRERVAVPAHEGPVYVARPRTSGAPLE